MELTADLQPSTSTSDKTPATTTKKPTIPAMVQITTDGVPKLHCPVCNKALVSLNGYVKHIKKHEPPGGFLCRYCEARYCSDEELKKHREEVHTIIACRICKDVITFTSEHDYREHIRIVHNGIDRELFKCDKCGAEYKTSDAFRRHMENECGTIKPYKCDQCSMTFVTKYNLKQHKESHSGERKYCCSYCGKNFLQKGRLVEHERSHTGEKPYKCDVCGKCFAHRESIVTHSSIHTGIRLVECKCCLSRFSCYSNLIKHRRTRPESCGLPEYDPPRNRIRTHRSRIPPTLNPTSEIKVSGLNKIIKPGHKEQQQVKKAVNKKDETTDKVANKTARKRTGAGPLAGAPTKRKPYKKQKNKKLNKDTDDELDEELADIASNSSNSDNAYLEDYTIPETRNNILNKRSNESIDITIKANNTTITIKTNSPRKSDSDSEEFKNFDDGTLSDESYVPDDAHDIKMIETKLPIKQELPETETAVKAAKTEHDIFDYINAQQDEHDFNIKSEDEANIFNEKDKLLDSLLNDNDVQLTDFASSEQPTRGMYKYKSNSAMQTFKLEQDEEEDILQEPEVVLIKNEDSDVPTEEDMLQLNETTNDSEAEKCHILLEDITKRYPALKEDASVRVARNAAPLFRLSKRESRALARGDKPVRKYRKRGEPKTEDDSSAPKRIAKLSQRELKARLKLLKREEKSWPCPHCIKIYHMRKPFEKHLRDDHKRPEEEIKKLFKADNVGVVNEEIFKCHICDKIYLIEKRLLAHIKLHGPNGDLVFKCPCYCSTHFATKADATKHAHEEHRDLLFCEPCQKFMTGHDSLKSHIKNHHNEKSDIDKVATPRLNAKRNLVCDKCGKKFSGRTSLTDHVRSECGRKPLYPCAVCGKHLTTAGILKTHMLLHKDDTPFQCEQCGKTFKVKAQYKTHLKTRHTNHKPYKCHLCPKAYPYRESLLTHMTVHTGIKRFLCSGCGKRFTCISNLQAHRKVHADTCGLLPLNAKATQYMGVQKGNLLLGAKPEAGLDYIETNTLLAKDVLDRDLPMAQELNFPSEPSAPLATVPLNYSQPAPFIPMIMAFVDNSQQSSHATNSSAYN